MLWLTISYNAVQKHFWCAININCSTANESTATKVRVPCPDIIKIYTQGMGSVDLVDQRTEAYHVDCKSSIRLSRSFYRFDGCSLCQRLFSLQYDALKRPYPAWLQNHHLNLFDWSVHKSHHCTSRTKSWIKEKT